MHQILSVGLTPASKHSFYFTQLTLYSHFICIRNFILLSFFFANFSRVVLHEIYTAKMLKLC